MATVKLKQLAAQIGDYISGTGSPVDRLSGLEASLGLLKEAIDADESFLSANTIDEDDMVSDSELHIPTQQSTKANVDSRRSAIEGGTLTVGIGTLRDIGDAIENDPDYFQTVDNKNLRYRQVYVDNFHGLDTGTLIGLRQRVDRPFKTGTKAIAAALANDTVVIGPGVYAENLVLKTGVDIILMPGVTINGNIDDSGGAVVCQIWSLGGPVESHVNGTFNIIEAASTITVYGLGVTATTAPVCTMTDGNLLIKGGSVFTTNHASAVGIQINGGTLSTKDCEITTTGSGLAIDASGSESVAVEGILRLGKLVGSNVTFDTAAGNGIVLSKDATISFSGGLVIKERSADPVDPAEGETVIWMSDGTGIGDDGDVMIKGTAGAVTKYNTLSDHSAGT